MTAIPTNRLNGSYVEEAPTPEVDLTSLILDLARHVELDVTRLQACAVDSDTGRDREDYRTAIEGAQALLDGLVRGVALELRRPRGESVEAFRARNLTAGSFEKCCRFLAHKRFLDKEEKHNALRAFLTATIPGAQSGVSLEGWSRNARQMVFAVVRQVTARYVRWKAGCSCPAAGPAEVVFFQPAGGAPMYERAICRQCRCPREPGAGPAEGRTTAAAPAAPSPILETVLLQEEERPTSQVYGGTDTPEPPAELLSSPFGLVMSLLYQVRGERWRDDGFDEPLLLSQSVADLLNELRSFSWMDLPPAVSEALQSFDKPKLMMVCVRSVQLLHGLVGPQRDRHRASRRRKHERQKARKREQRTADLQSARAVLPA
jgi:hypothetical protein